MESYTLENVTVSVIQDTRRPKKDNLFPIKYRVYFMQIQAYYPCMDLTEKDWIALNKRGKKPEELTKTLNLIKAGFNRITDIVKDLVNTEGFSFDALNRRLSRGVKDSILSAFENKIERLNREGKICSASWYSCALTSIEKYAKKDLKFANITKSWLEGYEAHLLEQKKSFTTVSMYMRALRAIINEGLRDKIITPAQYPFVIKDNGKYQIPVEVGRKIALTEEQLIGVFDYPLLPDEEKWRDLWVFSFYCNGANINDILNFKYKNIVGNYIEWYRGKTLTTGPEKSKIKVFLRDEMKDIIKARGNPDHKPDNYIFPFLMKGLSPLEEKRIIQNVTHNINKKMRKIGIALGIGNITTYWARHTWASISRSAGTPLFTISKGMGHKNLHTTELYLDSLSDQEIQDAASRLPSRNNK